MPLPPPPTDTDPELPVKPDTGADTRMHAHMIGAPGAAAPAGQSLLARIGHWLRRQVLRRR